MRVLFEPWSLGDALIAAAILRELPSELALATDYRWHNVLREAREPAKDLRLLPAALPYTTRDRAWPFPRLKALAPTREVREVLSIRGDPRDLVAARQLFPGARIRMTGWTGFIARKSWLLDSLLIGLGQPVRNRYRAWAALAGVPFSAVVATYQKMQARAPRSGLVALHVGARWRSKQYPHVAELREVLQRGGLSVVVVAGPSDPLPAGVEDRDVTRAADGALVELFRSAEYVIANDSGPMHLAAFVGCRTVAVARMANLDEWLPPCTGAAAASLPRGYRPNPAYETDRVIDGWPTPVRIAEVVTARAASV